MSFPLLDALVSYFGTVFGLGAEIIAAAFYYLTRGLLGFFGIPA